MNKVFISVLCVVFLLVLGDCVSTYLCLSTPAPEHLNVWEANLLSAWSFQAIGLVPGLVAFIAIKAAGLVIIYNWAQRGSRERLIFTGLMVGVAVMTAYVNYNNFYIYHLLSTS
jgi:hypothetical protein